MLLMGAVCLCRGRGWVEILFSAQFCCEPKNFSKTLGRRVRKTNKQNTTRHLRGLSVFWGQRHLLSSSLIIREGACSSKQLISRAYLRLPICTAQDRAASRSHPPCQEVSTETLTRKLGEAQKEKQSLFLIWLASVLEIKAQSKPCDYR